MDPPQEHIYIYRIIRMVVSRGTPLPLFLSLSVSFKEKKKVISRIVRRSMDLRSSIFFFSRCGSKGGNGTRGNCCTRYPPTRPSPIQFDADLGAVNRTWSPPVPPGTYYRFDTHAIFARGAGIRGLIIIRRRRSIPGVDCVSTE